MKQLPAKIFLALCSAALCLAVAEIGVRALGHRDADGNFYFHQRRVRPYRLPVHTARRLLDEYRNAQDSALVYDADLGWTSRPLSHENNADGFFCNVAKLDEAPPPGTVRIALFGGSFTQNSFRGGWWRELEKHLAAAGVKAEILNFGVGAYGMDQAYLRWKKQGAKFHPHIVIFGFVAGNVQDNVNVLRLFANPTTGIPFFKPRFVAENDSLKLIDTPTPPPDEIGHLIERFAGSPLARYEHFFHPEDYQMRWWRHSKLLAYAEAKFRAAKTHERYMNFYLMSDEPARLAMEIVRQFQTDTMREGSEFFIVHLPAEDDVKGLQLVGSLPFDALLREVEKIAPMIHPEIQLAEAAKRAGISQLYREGHHTPEAHAIIGKTAAAFLLQKSSILKARAAAR